MQGSKAILLKVNRIWRIPAHGHQLFIGTNFPHMYPCWQFEQTDLEKTLTLPFPPKKENSFLPHPGKENVMTLALEREMSL